MKIVPHASVQTSMDMDDAHAAASSPPICIMRMLRIFNPLLTITTCVCVSLVVVFVEAVSWLPR